MPLCQNQFEFSSNRLCSITFGDEQIFSSTHLIVEIDRSNLEKTLSKGKEYGVGISSCLSFHEGQQNFIQYRFVAAVIEEDTSTGLYMPSVLKVNGDFCFKITDKRTETLSELEYNTLLTMNSKIVLYENVKNDKVRSSKMTGEKVPPYVQYEFMENATDEILKLVSEGNPPGDDLVPSELNLSGNPRDINSITSRKRKENPSLVMNLKRNVSGRSAIIKLSQLLGQTNVVGQN